MQKQVLVAVAIIVIVLVVGLLVSRRDGAQKSPAADLPVAADDATPLDDMIHVFDPSEGTTVYSPIDVFGEARGAWFSEGTFPVRLYDNEGNLLSEGVASSTSASADGWMTDDFVPFEASLSYQEPPKTDTGTLVLMRDNPSGDPANDMQVVIPVQFDSAE